MLIINVGYDSMVNLEAVLSEVLDVSQDGFKYVRDYKLKYQGADNTIYCVTFKDVVMSMETLGTGKLPLDQPRLPETVTP